MRKTKETQSGITLIALVITIIVLLILAGISIAMLTGDNGLLTKAITAKAETEKATAEEEVKLEVFGSYDDNGKFDYSTFKTNVENNLGAAVKDNGDGTCTVTHKGYDVTVNKTTGVIISTVKTGETPPPPAGGEYNTGTTVAEAKTQDLPFENDTTITDDFNNPVKVPAGFKIGAESATAVTGGVVIEDATYEGTIGSEFVWIPVGNVKTSTSDTTGTPITLGRYDFNSSGETGSVSSSYTEDTQENHNSDYGNAIATNIDGFIAKANASHGYYIGRYEARVDGATLDESQIENSGDLSYYTGSAPMWTGYTNGQLVCKSGSQVWNLITQNKASDLSKNMYTGKTFTSDLMNSYAWDTATLFLQTFDDRTWEGKKVYSRQNSLNTELANEGTNSLTDSSKQDKICNVWDMASNCAEWTTETNAYSSGPCVSRGGIYGLSGDFTSDRGFNFTTVAGSSGTFRPLLYL